MSKFSFVHETETHEVHQHPDGHLLHIKKSLKKTDMPVQHFAAGTPDEPVHSPSGYGSNPEVEQLAQQQSADFASNSALELQNQLRAEKGLPPLGAEQVAPSMAPAQASTESNLNSIGLTAPSQLLQQPIEQTAPAAAAPAEPAAKTPLDTLSTVYQNELNAMKAGYGQQLAGINAQAVAEGKLGASNADAINATLNLPGGINDVMSSYQNHQTELNNKRNALVSDIQAGHIDPNRLWNDSSTASKVSASIGLILGGLASGVNGGPNQVLGMINNMIDRDVAAQKADLGKKENLLAANMQDMNNLRDATQMTKAMKLDALAHQLQMNAARSADPIAQAKAKQAAGALTAQSAAIVGQLASKTSMLNAASNGKVDPSLLVRTIVDEKERPEAYKQLQSAKEMVNFRNNVLEGVNHISKLNTMTNRVLSPLQSQSQIDAIWAPLVTQMSKETAGRFTEADMKQLDTLKPSWRDDAQSLRVKKAQLNKLVTEKMNFPVLNAYNIRIPGMPGTPGAQIQETQLPLK